MTLTMNGLNPADYKDNIFKHKQDDTQVVAKDDQAKKEVNLA